MIDQTLLPTTFQSISCKTVSEVVEAIQSMRIRGAPAIGAAAAMGVALSVYLSTATTKKDLLKEIANDASALRNARPTAANLAWGVDQVLQFIKNELPEALGSVSREQVIDFVTKLAEDDVSTNKQLSDLGSKLFRSHESVLTHCK
jgi:methylthioribose-1-phosphate isomerase